MPCSYDLEVTASRYLDALTDGTVPLEFLFSGSVFYTGGDGELQTTRLSWNSEADVRAAGERVEGDDGALLPRDGVGAALARSPSTGCRAYKSRNALATWDDALEALGL